MSTKEELILENELLRKKLALAGDWMKKEVAQHKKSLREVEAKKTGRSKLDNMLEKESVDIITRKIRDYFGDSLEFAPKFTLNHLIDAEIYWQTLQKFPTLDALPVVSSYQKILDNFFQARFTQGFQSITKIPKTVPQKGLDTDIANILTKGYSLSLGRWFQFFSKIREGGEFGGCYEDLLLAYLSEHHEALLETCITDPFFSGFAELISIEVFGRKRHDTKISYGDAKKVRELCVEKKLLQQLFY